MNAPLWIMFSGTAINKFHITTVRASRLFENESVDGNQYVIQLSLSNGAVFSEQCKDEEVCAARFSEITGISG